MNVDESNECRDSLVVSLDSTVLGVQATLPEATWDLPGASLAPSASACGLR